MTHHSTEPWIARVVEEIAARAEPWMKMSGDELWDLMFGPAIPRSWHVWSDGHCPACKQPVPMYEWRVDAMARRWKMTCPKCATAFPTNDFEAYHRSGLNPAGWFDPSLADRSLLFNSDHPDPADPLHFFGVDDGEGFVSGEHRWRFIGAYLIYGHWRQLVIKGVDHLADAYAVTKNPTCAHKALIVIDRVADIFPQFDFAGQSWMYEKPGHTVRSDGHVTYWCENCEDVRMFAEAYRTLKERTDDEALVSFLAAKHHPFVEAIAKYSGQDIRQNVESRIFHEAISKPIRMRSNFPRAEIAKVALHDAIGTPESQTEAEALTESLIHNTTSVDGLTGEKGLPTYSAYVIASLSGFMANQERSRPGFIRNWVDREPNLKKTWRFFLDTRCLGQYYPAVGDALWFGARTDKLCGVHLPAKKQLGEAGGVGASAFSFLWWLYEATGDVDYVRALYEGNDSRLDDLPRDIGADDPPAFRAKIAKVLALEGAQIKLPSVDKIDWHLAILRSGEGKHARALWIDYDTGGNHGHMDGMNVGLMAHGLDLIPDFGYPPVQFGGWGAPKSRWYYQTAAHHTVVVDGKSQPEITNWAEIDSQGKSSDAGGPVKYGKLMLPKLLSGTTKLWKNQPPCQIVRIDGSAIYGRPDVKQYERTLMLIDVDSERFYVVDVFRVVGGTDHAKFVHGYFGDLETSGLALTSASDFGHGTLMRNFQCDPTPPPHWTATWRVADKYGYLKLNQSVTMRYHDLSIGASASTCEAWVNGGHYADIAETWIPRLMLRRQSTNGELSSCFVNVLEVFEREPVIAKVRRLRLTSELGTGLPDSCVGLEVELSGGIFDRIYLTDVQNPLGNCPWPMNSRSAVMIDAERGEAIKNDVEWRRSASK